MKGRLVLWALVLAAAIAITSAMDCQPVSAKQSYGPCVDYYVGQWYAGEIGGVLLFGKIHANCREDGGW
jgi:hypothetical protein